MGKLVALQGLTAPGAAVWSRFIFKASASEMVLVSLI